MVKRCSKCNTDNPIDAKYCRWCGMLLIQSGGPKVKESSPSGTQSERTGTVAKVVFSIAIIALAIYLIYVFNMVGKTGVIVGAGGVLREIWKSS